MDGQTHSHPMSPKESAISLSLKKKNKQNRCLNELIKGHFVNCFSGFNIQYSGIFAEKM